MFSFSKVFLGTGVFLSTVGVGFLIAYETTKKTISDGLNGKRIVFGNSGSSEMAWTHLLTRLNKNPSRKPKSDEFKSLKNKSLSPSKDFLYLKNLCVNSSTQNYLTLAGSNENLMEDVKNFCTLTIKENFKELSHLYLNASLEYSNPDKSEFIDNLKRLKNEHDESKSGRLVQYLSDLRSSIPSDFDTNNETWKRLAKWCGKSYGVTFLHEEEPIVKQVNVYCQRYIKDLVTIK